MHARHTITLNQEAFQKLKTAGKFQESYSDVILRTFSELDTLVPSKEDSKEESTNID